MSKKEASVPGRLAPQAKGDLLQIESAILELRGERVILDADLAALYGVETKRLNEQVKRNANRFGAKYAFVLSRGEFEALRSQSATSKVGQGRGGRRYPPWAFTEYGVVMAATILDSDRAVEVSRLIVDVFVEIKRRVGRKGFAPLATAKPDETSISPLERLSVLGDGMADRLQAALQHVLDSVIDTRRNTTVREEAENLIGESICSIKERLKKQGLENEELAARAAKLLAEAEKEKAIAAKTTAETDALAFAVVVKKLRLLLEVQRAIEHDRLDEFLGVLKELGG